MKTLNKIKTGKVVKFGYVDGEHTPYYGKVVDHRDLESTRSRRILIARILT